MNLLAENPPKLIKLMTNEEHKNDFYRKGFWICLVYVLWDTFTALGII